MPTLLFVVLKGVQICYGVALEDVLALAWKNASWKTGKNIDIPTFALKKKNKPFKTDGLHLKSRMKSCLSVFNCTQSNTGSK